MNIKEIIREKHCRDNGWLSEIFSMNHKDSPFDCFHSYIVTIPPKSVRAMHYHRKKREWIALASGKIKFFFEDVVTKDRLEKILDENSENFSILFIPSMMAHAVKNIGESNASLIVFSKSGEMPEDTFHYKMEV